MRWLIQADGYADRLSVHLSAPTQRGLQHRTSVSTSSFRSVRSSTIKFDVREYTARVSSLYDLRWPRPPVTKSLRRTNGRHFAESGFGFLNVLNVNITRNERLYASHRPILSFSFITFTRHFTRL